MQYALLIYAEESAVPALSEVEREQLFADYRAFNAALREAGAWGGSVKLCDTATATSTRVADGRTLTTDGPFAETKECLAGFYTIEVANLDEALAWAARVPGARIGSVEVRPVDWRG